MMRTSVIVLTAVFFIAGLASTLCGDDPNDISAYFGFDEMEIIKLDSDIRSMQICDFDGDGRNDIAIANNRKSRIDLLMQKESIGLNDADVVVDSQDIDINAIFENVPTRFKREPISVSQSVYSLVCGDFNGDGLQDVAFYGGDPKGIYVILQKKQDEKNKKQLSWQTRKRINIDDALSNPDSTLRADINNDGKDDIILAASDGVYIVEQKSDGTLAEPVKYPCSDRVIGIEIGDLNGDKINDLVIVTDGEKPLSVRFGTKEGQLTAVRQFLIERPISLILYNIDGLPGDEVLMVDSKSKRLLCYKYNLAKKTIDEWPTLLYPLSSGEQDMSRDMAVADFDGDGLKDVVISNPGSAELIFYKQANGSGLMEQVFFPSLADITSLSAADIDGDNKTELAVLSVKEKIIGLSKYENGRFSFPKPLAIVGEPIACELTDVDGDGRIDCVYLSKSGENQRFLRVVYNVAGSAIPNPNSLSLGFLETALEIKKLGSNPSGIRVLDVDGYGLKDVLVFVKYESPILIRQLSKGEFEVIDSPQAQGSLIKDATPGSISIGDVDAKGVTPLLIAQKNYARSLYFADGKSWTVLDQYNAKSTENQISAVASFDLEGLEKDGSKAVFLLDGQKGQLQMLTASKDKTYRFEKEFSVGRWENADHLKMLYEPLTGGSAKSILLFDGKKFAIITPSSGGSDLGDLEQLFSYETKIKDGAYSNLVAGDINADGTPDIVLVDYKNNNIEILTLDSAHKPLSAMRFKTFEQKMYSEQRGMSGPEPRELKIQDVTGDGKNDLVTVIHDRIIIYPQ